MNSSRPNSLSMAFKCSSPAGVQYIWAASCSSGVFRGIGIKPGGTLSALGGCWDSGTPPGTDGLLTAPAQEGDANSIMLASVGPSVTLLCQHCSMAFSNGLCKSEEGPTLDSKHALSGFMKYLRAWVQEVEASMVSQVILNWLPKNRFTMARIWATKGLAGLLFPPYIPPSATVASSIQNCNSAHRYVHVSWAFIQMSMSRLSMTPGSVSIGFTAGFPLAKNRLCRNPGMSGVGELLSCRYSTTQSIMVSICIAASSAIVPKYLIAFTSAL